MGALSCLQKPSQYAEIKPGPYQKEKLIYGNCPSPRPSVHLLTAHLPSNSAWEGTHMRAQLDLNMLPGKLTTHINALSNFMHNAYRQRESSI